MADLPKEFFRRVDEADDELFYEFPRKVVHIDDGAIAAVRGMYADRLPPGGEILDLMSSWRSHLPESLGFKQVVGLGLNRPEMEDNPALTGAVIHNVNRDPRLPFADASFDGAVMTVSVQYLTRPVEVFAEVGRVLRMGGPFIVTFSNRMFPTKAIALWQAASDGQRIEIVKRYFADSRIFERIETFDLSRRPGAPSDPIWGVAGYRTGAPERRPQG
ncbi:MAG TPA: methyltransferase domain-containing protein [Candidatus Binataceae bacterium]|nr:methyltransferase domain-containing protein [Candidatus Binataceae bacterium]